MKSSRKRSSLLSRIKEAGEDFEWYPTTESMIDKVIEDYVTNHVRGHRSVSILDIGAGDGKFIESCRSGFDRHSSQVQVYPEFYAIEKSQILSNNLPEYCFKIGSDFMHNSLQDKELDFIFCNPPYSEYESWTQKIIKEAPIGSVVYLVIPSRWSNSSEIQRCLSSRGVKAQNIYSADFLSSEDRKARAKVDILKIPFDRHYHEDPFSRFFEDQFGDSPAFSSEQAQELELEDQVNYKLSLGSNIIEALVSIYDAEMVETQKVYSTLSQVPAEVLAELDVTKKDICKILKNRLNTLKSKYWDELLKNMDSVIKRLTESSRQNIINTLHSNQSVDFNHDNCYNIVLWCIKNANKYFDSQLIEVFEELVESANVKLYKSNERVFSDQDWRYARKEFRGHGRVDEDRAPTHYSLDFRVVLHNSGGIVSKEEFGYYDSTNGLSRYAATILNDLLVIAENLGYSSPHRARSFEWTSGKKNLFN